MFSSFLFRRKKRPREEKGEMGKRIGRKEMSIEAKRASNRASPIKDLFSLLNYSMNWPVFTPSFPERNSSTKGTKNRRKIRREIILDDLL